MYLKWSTISIKLKWNPFTTFKKFPTSVFLLLTIVIGVSMRCDANIVICSERWLWLYEIKDGDFKKNVKNWGIEICIGKITIIFSMGIVILCFGLFSVFWLLLKDLLYQCAWIKTKSDSSSEVGERQITTVLFIYFFDKQCDVQLLYFKVGKRKKMQWQTVKAKQLNTNGPTR